MKKTKRFFSLFLAMLCVLSLFTFTASACSHESPATVTAVMPRTPTCAKCGGSTRSKPVVTGEVVNLRYRDCPQGTLMSHSLYRDVYHYWCDKCNEDNGISYIYKYEVCGAGICPTTPVY